MDPGFRSTKTRAKAVKDELEDAVKDLNRLANLL